MILFSPNDNKTVISKDVQFDKSKGWNWMKILNDPMQNDANSRNIRTILQEDHVEEVMQEQEVRRSTWA